MILRGFVALKIILFSVIATNGETNPLFICQRHHETMDTYIVVVNQRDEIVINNCTSSLIEDIIRRIHHSSLRGRPVHFNTATVMLNEIHLDNLTNLDISENNLTEVNLENFEHLKYLNLTSNRLHSMKAVRLRQNITLKSLDLSRNRLLKLEHRTIPQTERLYLRSNNIFELDKDIMLPSTLVELDLTRNEVENISGNSFISKSLKIMNLGVNLINSISKITFQHLPSLEKLILYCNRISEIEVGTFSHNVKLIELNLRDNNLSVLKNGVFDDLINLQALDISKNGLLQLSPDTVQNLNNLVHFSLSENLKLCKTECKKDLEFLLVLGGHLKVLKMNHLKLRQFPVTLTTSIQHLDLSQNKLNSIQIGDLENFPFLKTLILSSNEIETTEKYVFSRMEYLQELYLNDNLLKQVPSGLPTSLKILHLNGNRITVINTNDLKNLIRLKVLKLNSNFLHSVETDSFRFLYNLEILDISCNPITHLSTDAFEGPSKLKILQASSLEKVNINVTDLRYFPISEMPNLRYLNLSRSPQMVKSFLTDLPLLTTIKQLEILDLSYANLTELPRHLETLLPHLKRVILIGNPMNCTDHWWQEWKLLDTSDMRKSTMGNTTLTIRIVKKFMEPSSNRVIILSRCPIHNNKYTIISNDQFWKSLELTNVTTFPIISSLKTNHKSFKTKYKDHIQNTTDFGKTIGDSYTFGNFSSTVSRIPPSIFLKTVHVIKSTTKRKKLNSRSLSDFINSTNTSNWLPANLNSTSNLTDYDTSSSSTKLLESYHSTSTSSAILSSFSKTNLSKDVIVTTPPQLTISLSTISSALSTKTIISSRNIMKERNKNGTSIKNLFSFAHSMKTNKINNTELQVTLKSISEYVITPIGSSAASQTTKSRSTENFELQHRPEVHSLFATKASNDAILWNRTKDHTSFFDWFPALNETSDPSERIAALNDDVVEHTHPGLIIFSSISCVLVIVFFSLIIPPCVQKYRWTKYRNRRTEFDSECQRSIEISSISAFIETEISAE